MDDSSNPSGAHSNPLGPRASASAGSPLALELHKAAADFASSSLRAYLAGDRAVFLLHAATALEQLSKAFLASIHGSLVAGNDFDSLLHVCGHPARARSPRTRMRTITA